MNRQNRPVIGFRQAVVAAVALITALAAGVALWGGFYYSNLTTDLPSLLQIPILLEPPVALLQQPTRLYDRTGSQLLYVVENQGVPRRYLPLQSTGENITENLVTATVALQDPEFFNYPDRLMLFTPARLLAAEPQGLAELLVNDLLLAQEPVGLRRTLRMRLLGIQLVQRYGHRKVVEWYLNSANYGHLAFGVDAAARLYLNKPASQLDLAESVLLAAIAQTPALNPLDSPESARARQREALSRLLVQGTISPELYQSSLNSPPVLRSSSPTGQSRVQANAFTRLALEQAYARYGRSFVERGGLKITTTLDMDFQKQLTCLSRLQVTRLTTPPQTLTAPDAACPAGLLLPSLSTTEPLPADLSVSGVLLDLENGQVLAMLGDTTLQGESNIIAEHDPGSLLSPYVLVAALARGYSPASLVWDIPPANTGSGIPAGYANPDGIYHGPLRLRQAVANDYMLPLVTLLDQLGPATVWKLAQTLGLSSLPQQTESNTVGYGQALPAVYKGSRLPILEISQAYSVFANQGMLIGQRTAAGNMAPVVLLKVEDERSQVLAEYSGPDTQHLLSAPIAYLVHHVLSDEPARWATLGYPNPLEIGRPAAAKIGRTLDGTDSWVTGYTSRYLATFWLGVPAAIDPAGRTPQKINPRGTAGLWHALMQYLHRGLPVGEWKAPAGISQVDVCHPSGLLPTQACPTVVNEVFISGNEPSSLDTLYRTLQINRETGRLATVFTPPVQVQEKTFLFVPAEARDWARSAGLPVPPVEYDAIQLLPPRTDVIITAPEMFSFLSGKVKLRGSAGGESFSSFRIQAGQGLNPQTWLPVIEDRTVPVQDGDLGVWDTAQVSGGRRLFSDGLYALRLTVIRQNQQVDSAVLQVTIDNTPPQIRSIVPLENQQFNVPAGSAVSFQTEILEAVGIRNVEWWIDGQRVAERQQAPFTMTWQVTPGAHTLVIKAVDLAGNENEADPVKFSVGNAGGTAPR